MKTHTNNFKQQISIFGRQLDSKITYTQNNEEIELGAEELNSISPHYKADILKSVMKQLDIDSNIDIPIGTTINYKFGVKVGNAYEYLDYGNYIVYSSERQEDLRSYKIIAYDKMLLSMKDYEDMSIIYPISLRNYLGEICDYLGITFANTSDTFANYNRMIQNELYLDSDGNSLGYTFRDVLDEIAQATGSTICINEDDELEIRYITETNDTIDEEFFKDINVNFGEKYGPINSIVLSRSAGVDNVYLKDDESITQNGLCEIKISDNQIMNGNDRSDYLPDLLSQLDGLEYYLNDYASTGIMYYDVCDRYTAHIGDSDYSCVMLNDEPIITQGLVENIYTERPIPSETDYSKADKTDRKINQTTLIVDKQNQQIQSIVSQIGDRETKTTTITQDIDGLIAEVQDIPTITTEQGAIGNVELSNLLKTKMIELRVHPTNVDIIALVVSNSLKVRSTLKLTTRTITVSGDETFKYKIPKNLYYYNNDVYDEFVYDGLNKRVYIIHRVGVDTLGNKSILATPIEEDFEYYDMIIGNGDNEIYMIGYPSAYIYAKAMIKNDYTDSFATSYEVDSKIELKANEINEEVRQKVDEDEVVAKLNLGIRNNQGVVELIGNSVIIDSDNFDLDEYGNVNMRGGNIYLGEGSQILGDDGLMSTILVLSNICSHQFVGGSTLLPMGFSVVGENQSGVIVGKDWLSFEFDIPNNFVVKSAKIILTHVPVNYTGYNTATGYSRKLKLYKSSDGLNQNITLNDMYYYFVNDNTGYTEIQNAFGSNGFTGNSSYGEEQTSIELKDYITTGFNKFKIQSDETTPTTILQCYQYSGACMGTLYITGYTNFEEPATMMTTLGESPTLLQGNEQTSNVEQEQLLGQPNQEEESDI